LLLKQARQNPQVYVTDEPADGDASEVESETFATPVMSMLSWITSSLSHASITQLKSPVATVPLTSPKTAMSASTSFKVKVAERFPTGITACIILEEMAKEAAAILLSRLKAVEKPQQDEEDANLSDWSDNPY
jgi:hypothetical protein